MHSHIPAERLAAEARQLASPDGATALAGTLHVYVAFDWGDEVNLERARGLLPAETQVLPRRRRTPTSIAYRPPPPGDPLVPAGLRQAYPAWLAGLLRLESGTLSDEEIAEAMRLHLSYSPDDLFLPDWAAAVLLDHDCNETLQAIEFANLQLLE